MSVNEVRGRRAIVLVIDACGVGALPDAEAYGDEGTNTLAHVAKAVGGLDVPVLSRLGLGAILPLQGVPAPVRSVLYGALHPLGPGKDSIAGHWELMGVVVDSALPSYPEGLPEDLVRLLCEATGHKLICNEPANGVAAIEEFGPAHLRSGALILYTSQDSVLQLAAHVERVPVQALYEACLAARSVMIDELGVGRVIARPFTGQEGSFNRTDGRRDFALDPPGRSYLQDLQDAGVAVHGVGKISDLFAGRGVSASHPGATNAAALASTAALIDELAEGLVFVNLIETDQVHGHRKDTQGFHEALREIDSELGRWIPRLRSEDLLVVTADHGVDPYHPGTDHTREYVPLLAGSGEMCRRALGGSSLDSGGASASLHEGPLADVGASVLRWLRGIETDGLPGRSFLS